VGHGLFIHELSRSHTTTHQSVGLLWTSDQLVAETSTCKHTTLTTDRHPCPRWDSNPQSQQASGRRPRDHWERLHDTVVVTKHAISWRSVLRNKTRPSGLDLIPAAKPFAGFSLNVLHEIFMKSCEARISCVTVGSVTATLY